MYFRNRAEPARGYPSIATGVVLVVLAAVVLMLGVFPSPLLALVQ
jgi:NADH:ubiquinone oxidoreductase subunit 2 (subunit N)